MTIIITKPNYDVFLGYYVQKKNKHTYHNIHRIKRINQR